MKSVKLPIKVLIILFAFFMIGLVSEKLNTTYAASTSYDINAIDESKYPGYKSALQGLQAQYPNWRIKLLYTGLDWNDVIDIVENGCVQFVDILNMIYQKDGIVHLKKQ